MNRAVIFDLYETLVTENHPEWYSGVPPYERLRVTQDAFDRERSVHYHARWFIETWPWDWVTKIAGSTHTFPQCRKISDLSSFIDSVI